MRKLKKFCFDNEISINSISRGSGVNIDTVIRIDKGLINNITIKTVKKINNYLKTIKPSIKPSEWMNDLLMDDWIK
jgi:hypothetical protein